MDSRSVHQTVLYMLRMARPMQGLTPPSENFDDWMEAAKILRSRGYAVDLPPMTKSEFALIPLADRVESFGQL